MSTDVLVVDPEEKSRQELVKLVSQNGFKPFAPIDVQELFDHLARRDFGAILLGLTFREEEEFELIRRIRAQSPQVPIFIISAAEGDVDTAVEVMKLGVTDYFARPLNEDKLLARLKSLPESKKAACPGKAAKETVRYSFTSFIGESEAMQKVFALIHRVSKVDSTVLVYGESGTGKELVARAIHFNSNRGDNQLIPINCGAIPEDLLESELFGHEKGAFTGALRTRIGRFELAHKGTIFLDEIGDMSPTLQVKLLRVLQEHKFERIGGVKTIETDARVIAATHRNLEKLIADGRFREDLFYRLNVIPILVPPLRERKSDIALMTAYFLDRFNREKNQSVVGFSDQTMECLINYHWPGNVRELENIIERVVIIKGEGVIEPADLPESIAGCQISDPVPVASGPPRPVDEDLNFNTAVSEFEKELILSALHSTNWVKNQAAKKLNIKRTTLVEKMKKLNLSKDDD
ncbi:MAG: sigma-54-dependent Fis family transcriptional regulator [Deltaproteobacteria bacterium]|nr:sigma-54-dependent Fis family transcriptional regulator [Deltaproteobacteria bacterium]